MVFHMKNGLLLLERDLEKKGIPSETNMKNKRKIEKRKWDVDNYIRNNEKKEINREEEN